MLTEDIRARIHKKWEDTHLKIQRGYDLPSSKRSISLLENLLRYETHQYPSSSLTLVRENKLVKVVDDAVIRNPVGCALYRFSWLEELPEYVRRESFVNHARELWNGLGENRREEFRQSMMMVSDEEAYRFLQQASDQQLFDVYMSVEVICEEKFQALYALMHMANREMKEDEYLLWADKFGIEVAKS